MVIILLHERQFALTVGAFGVEEYYHHFAAQLSACREYIAVERRDFKRWDTHADGEGVGAVGSLIDTSGEYKERE